MPTVQQKQNMGTGLAAAGGVGKSIGNYQIAKGVASKLNTKAGFGRARAAEIMRRALVQKDILGRKGKQVISAQQVAGLGAGFGKTGTSTIALEIDSANIIARDIANMMAEYKSEAALAIAEAEAMEAEARRTKKQGKAAMIGGVAGAVGGAVLGSYTGVGGVAGASAGYSLGSGAGSYLGS